MRIELAIFLACLALAIALAHVVVTSRDRGAIGIFTVLVATLKGGAFLYRLAVTR